MADKPGSPFYELGIKDVCDGMGRVRVRQHVNPLSSRFQAPSGGIDWAAAFADPSLPLFVDMGCGPGRFLLLLARHHSRRGIAMNYLGLEIREPLVERANRWASELELAGRVHYRFTNVTVSLQSLLAGYPGPLASLAAQFPDPHFKKRHRKRRMVQASVVEVARSLLAPGGTVFLQSDVLGAVAAMRDAFEQHAADVLAPSPLHTQGGVFHWSPQQEAAASRAAAAAAAAAKAAQQAAAAGGAAAQQQGAANEASEQAAAAAAVDDEGGEQQEDQEDGSGFQSTWARAGWLSDNPLGVPTEREIYVASQGGKVFRVLLVKQ